MSSSTFSRRRLLTTAAAAALVTAVADDAGAARGWCRTDPAGTLDGYGFQVYLSSPPEFWGLNNSSGDVLILHPKDVKTKLVWVDPNGYFGQGVSTNFGIDLSLKRSATSMEVIVKAYIPASSANMPVRLEWAPGKLAFAADGTPVNNPVLAARDGVGNQWISLRTTLPYR